MSNYGLIVQTGGAMVVRGPKELLLELLSLGEEIERAEEVGKRWGIQGLPKEDAIRARVKSLIQGEENS